MFYNDNMKCKLNRNIIYIKIIRNTVNPKYIGRTQPVCRRMFYPKTPRLSNVVKRFQYVFTMNLLEEQWTENKKMDSKKPRGDTRSGWQEGWCGIRDVKRLFLNFYVFVVYWVSDFYYLCLEIDYLLRIYV